MHSAKFKQQGVTTHAPYPSLLMAAAGLKSVLGIIGMGNIMALFADFLCSFAEI